MQRSTNMVSSPTPPHNAKRSPTFADSSVELVGYGSNAQYHENDPDRLKANIDLTKRYIELMHDCGSGVKVKPGFVKDVPQTKPLSRLKKRNEVAEYGAGFGQEIRVSPWIRNERLLS